MITAAADALLGRFRPGRDSTSKSSYEPILPILPGRHVLLHLPARIFSRHFQCLPGDQTTLTAMASIRLKPNSRCYYACFTDSGGVQRQRSTQTSDRKLAVKIADELEKSYSKKKTEIQLRKVVADLSEEINGNTDFNLTFRAHCEAWLNMKKPEVVKATFKRYKQIVTDFLAFLGATADVQVDHISKDHILEYRAAVNARIKPQTTNSYIKILRHLFRCAVDDRLRIDNPATGVKLLKKIHDPLETRRPFAAGELRSLRSVLTGEWPTLVSFGENTGQRLGDIASITWSQIDLEIGFWVFTSIKMGREMRIPLTPSLLKTIQGMKMGGAMTPVFPEAFKAKRDRDGESRELSAKFHEFLVSANLATKRSKKNTGRGHGNARRTSQLSFHCLRHNATTNLKRAGVPESIVRDLIGHESEIVSRGYTHVDDEMKSAALAKMKTD